jgi:hypothetical protein
MTDYYKDYRASFSPLEMNEFDLFVVWHSNPGAQAMTDIDERKPLNQWT